jgi:hypothetical protein
VKFFEQHKVVLRNASLIEMKCVIHGQMERKIKMIQFLDQRTKAWLGITICAVGLGVILALLSGNDFFFFAGLACMLVLLTSFILTNMIDWTLNLFVKISLMKGSVAKFVFVRVSIFLTAFLIGAGGFYLAITGQTEERRFIALLAGVIGTSFISATLFFWSQFWLIPPATPPAKK